MPGLLLATLISDILGGTMCAPDEGFEREKERLDVLRRKHSLTENEYTECKNRLFAVKDAEMLVGEVLHRRL